MTQGGYVTAHGIIPIPPLSKSLPHTPTILPLTPSQSLPHTLTIPPAVLPHFP